MTKKLRERAKISVVHGLRVESAMIDYVVRTRFIQRIHYKIGTESGTDLLGSVDLAAEGTAWVRGWNNIEAEALAVSAALR